jgi:gamma-glutamyltranspeptidase
MQGAVSACTLSGLLTTPCPAFTQEDGTPDEVVQQLAARGHNVRLVHGAARSIFGKGTIITRTPAPAVHDGSSADAADGSSPAVHVLCGGSDPRGDGCVMAW